MKKMIQAILMIISILLSGCAAKSISSNADYMNSTEYQQKQTLKKSLFSGKNAPSDQDVQKILNSKLVIPKKIKLAIIKLKSDQVFLDYWSRYRQSGMSSKAFALDEELISGFIAALKKSGRIADISILPNLLIGEEISFDAFRIAALRSQADMMLILKPESFIDYRYNIFSANEAKSIATSESILIDVRTGLIPFSSIVSDQFIEKHNKDDYSMDETMLRSRQLSEGKAMKKTAEDLVQFFNSAR